MPHANQRHHSLFRIEVNESVRASYQRFRCLQTALTATPIFLILLHPFIRFAYPPEPLSNVHRPILFRMLANKGPLPLAYQQQHPFIQIQMHVPMRPSGQRPRRPLPSYTVPRPILHSSPQLARFRTSGPRREILCTGFCYCISAETLGLDEKTALAEPAPEEGSLGACRARFPASGFESVPGSIPVDGG